MTYNVGLTNGSTILFDEKDGFKTLRDAVEWGMGRGGKYSINVDIVDDDGEFFDNRHYSFSDGKLAEECGPGYFEPVSLDNLN